MNKSTILAITKIVTAVFFVVCLVSSFLFSAVWAMFNPNTVEALLCKQDFYAYADEVVADTVDDLQGIIGIETDLILKTIPKETLCTALQTYTNELTAHLLCGSEQPAAIVYEDKALYQLICEHISPSQYGGDTTQMEKDRNEAYGDLQRAISGVLTFFPQSLFDSAADISAKGGVPLSTAYRLIDIAKTAAIPSALATIVLGVLLLFLHKADKIKGLRLVATCTFIPVSVFFLITMFLGNLRLLDRLSLADGLLRRYIVTLAQAVGDGVVSVSVLLFVISVILLVASIVLQVRKNTCKKAETVVE